MGNKISFSQQVKEELVNNTYESSAKMKALLSAYIRINGKIVFKNKKTNLILSSENAQISKFIYSHLTKNYKSEGIHLNFVKKSKQAKRVIYEIYIDDVAEEIIDDLDINFMEGKVSREIAYNDPTISSYLAGVFLASGSVNSPVTSDYHLELCLNSENHAKWIAKLFPRFRGHTLSPKLTKRRDKYIVYFKKSDQISDFLVMIGAVRSCMEFENIRIDRDFVNTANRLANFDTANMMRTVKTAKRQKEEILTIQKVLGLNHFKNPKCELLCELRLEHESLSMDDLASMMSDITGRQVTKSNINHLFRQIHELYCTVTGKKE